METLKIDYPASHSTDTAWMAIDEDGHIATFWSSESGAVPTQAVRHDDDDEIKVDANNVHIWIKSLPHKHGLHKKIGFIWKPIAVLRSHERLFADYIMGDFKIEAVNGLLILRQGTRNVEEFNDLIMKNLDLCQACSGDGDMIPLATVAGIYKFSHPSSNAYAFPYKLEFRPPTPATLDTIDKEWLNKIPLMNTVKFPFCFAKKRSIQPLEYVGCSLTYNEDEFYSERGRKLKIK